MGQATGQGRQRGVLQDWNDERGFGFITSAAGPPRVFVHVSDFPRGRRPAVGSEVTYVEARDRRNRVRASEVRHVGHAVRRDSRRTTKGLTAAIATASLFFALVAGLLLQDEVPVWVPVAYAGFSAAAWVTYRADKSAARRGVWRTSESTLHLIALLGGWPGALVAQQALRHKTVKLPFRTIFWVTVVANCATLGWVVLSG